MYMILTTHYHHVSYNYIISIVSSNSDHVHPNVPCIIRNAIPSRSTTTSTTTTFNNGNDTRQTPLHLTLDDILQIIGDDHEITVDVTPDGHGDCVRTVRCREDSPDGTTENVRRMFVKPHEQIMSMGEFRRYLRRGVPSKNDNHGEEEGNVLLGDASPVIATGATAEQVVPREMDDYGLEVFPMIFHTKGNNEDDECNNAVHHEDENIDLGDPVVYYSRQVRRIENELWKKHFDMFFTSHDIIVHEQQTSSKKNDCLRTEMKKLFSHPLFPKTFQFAEEAFGTGPPDAINLWIGNEKSVSSMHKDHYENLFYVCSGQKEFVLCPPSDVLFLHEGMFSSGTFRRMNEVAEDGGRENGLTSHWGVVPDENDCEGASEMGTKWIEPDIKKICLEERHQNKSEFPLLSKAHPVKVLVSEGEMIYIPSLWYHRVTQTCETVGVNYWFDMKFDSPHWCYFNFLQNLKKI